MTADVQPPRSFLRRWSKPLIWLSVALNLLFVGMLLGAVWRFAGGPPGGPRMGGTGQMLGFIASLPAERRDTILREAGVSRGDLRELRQAVRDAGRGRMQALTAEPFDRQRVQEAQSRLEAAEARLRQVSTTLLLAAAASMTPDERRALARWRGPPDRDEDEHRRKK